MNKAVKEQPKQLTSEQEERARKITEFQQRVMFAEDNINFWNAMKEAWQSEAGKLINLQLDLDNNGKQSNKK
jgi:hypothetical protein